MPGSGGGTIVDLMAIHIDRANEFAPIPVKAVPAGADVLLIEDSADGSSKKQITVGAIGGGGGTVFYALHVQTATGTLGPGTTKYFGAIPKTWVTDAGTSKIYVRKAGTIKIAEIYCYSGTAGTGEDWSLYIRVNNTTDTLIATVGLAAKERIFSNAALSIPVVAGDYFEIKMVNPNWATPPATTYFGGFVYIEG